MKSKETDIYTDVCVFFTILGTIAFLILLINKPQKAWACYLISFFYFTSLALGGLFYTSLDSIFSLSSHLKLNKGVIKFRRFFEVSSAFLPYASFLGLIFMLFGAKFLYQWFLPNPLPQHFSLQHNIFYNTFYMNSFFAWVRWILFFGVWMFFFHHLIRSPLRENLKPTPSTHQRKRSSLIFLFIFSLTYSLFSFDALTSLESFQLNVFNTFFSFYMFSGLFQSTVAFSILLLAYKRIRSKEQSHLIPNDYYHLLGKILFISTLFYACVAFSQCFFLWFFDPERSSFLLNRIEKPWLFITLSLFAFKFILPFFALLLRSVRKNPFFLSLLSLIVLIMQYVDISWIVHPYYSKEHIVLKATDALEILIFLGFLSLFLISIHRFSSFYALFSKKKHR